MSSHFQPISPGNQSAPANVRCPDFPPETDDKTISGSAWTLPDDDFIDLAWSRDPIPHATNHGWFIFHGLEGGFRSPYAHRYLAAAARQGWLGLLCIFADAAASQTAIRRIYHSGETEDARYLLELAAGYLRKVPTGAVSYSLERQYAGLLSLPKRVRNAAVDAGIVVSAPLMLEPCSFKMEKGFSRFYQWYLLKGLKTYCHPQTGALPEFTAADKPAAYPRD